VRKIEGRRQKAEGRKQKAESRRQKAVGDKKIEGGMAEWRENAPRT
jgi:uncharacterized protein YjbJ (UPF0337 family)